MCQLVIISDRPMALIANYHCHSGNLRDRRSGIERRDATAAAGDGENTLQETRVSACRDFYSASACGIVSSSLSLKCFPAKADLCIAALAG